MSTWESCYSDWERVLSNTLSVVQPTTHTMQSPLKALFTLGPFHAPKLHSPYTLNPNPRYLPRSFLNGGLALGALTLAVVSWLHGASGLGQRSCKGV